MLLFFSNQNLILKPIKKYSKNIQTNDVILAKIADSGVTSENPSLYYSEVHAPSSLSFSINLNLTKVTIFVFVFGLF